MNLSENYNTAMQKYGEKIVKELLDNGTPPKYLLSACRFAKEGHNINELVSYFRQWMKYVVKHNNIIDVNKLSFDEFYQTIQKYKLDFSIPNKIYSDEIASFGKLNNAKDVQCIPVQNNWCIKSQRKFDDYAQQGYLFFVIYLPNEPMPFTYVIAAVFEGNVEYYDSYDYEQFEDLRTGNIGNDDHNAYQKKLPEAITTYLYNIAAKQGEALDAAKVDNNQDIKENKNMNKKQTIRLNESQFNNLVKKIVKESVKRMLKEGSLQWTKDDFNEFVYNYLDAQSVQNGLLIDTPFGNLQYKLSDEKTTLYIWFDNEEEASRLNDYVDASDVYDIAYRDNCVFVRLVDDDY